MMRTMRLREAKTKFSEVIDAAENGQPTVIIKNGKPAAAIVPINDARKLYPEPDQAKQRSLAEFLLAGTNAPRAE
ncbi:MULTISPECIES: type II toxin-antitoxin system Phd/YefM family antitoxin [unclassified Mesorhizobium]|uniref:type II toxin-antitoxin system Phd/YefM family antitoxin n=1 Tax=unclassified Mesorhizobium TaxID=325217 RepID=UPI001CCE62E8|nr:MULTISPECIES: type II toxin-antitoxin system prevent-host-death family antitoxin [unclassified Mesorhizobium]MBZ9920948.1 type II toxin-antitoxin system prevent-host-death family antitoxin [Mesorhizobium sp. BR1-1-7]MBZ9952474.1 type II toxin-antitoxin system prevent-host-death family antitoxin [Mesorhizobium sp. BR1-1-15]MBZ9968296.1 type II toxin-antitoxin system prevent-host-death family antitoxin [Mesorhizobium sp. BR1-1-12]